MLTIKDRRMWAALGAVVVIAGGSATAAAITAGGAAPASQVVTVQDQPSPSASDASSTPTETAVSTTGAPTATATATATAAEPSTTRVSARPTPSTTKGPKMTQPQAPAADPVDPTGGAPSTAPNPDASATPGQVAGQYNGGSGSVDNGPYPTRGSAAPEVPSATPAPPQQPGHATPSPS